MQVKKFSRAWIFLGVVVFCGSVLVNAPASIVGNSLQKAGIYAQQYSGSLWRGQASGLMLKVGVETIYFDQMHWDLNLLQLFLFSLSADITGTGQELSIEGEVDLLGGAHWRLEDAEIRFPARMIGQTTFGSFAGAMDVSLEQLEVEEALVKELSGQAAWDSARWFYDGRWWLLGSYAADLSSQDGGVQANIADQGGPIGLTGNLQVKLAGNYEFGGDVTPRDNAPRELAPLLSVIGEQNADNSYNVSFKGTF